MDKQRELELFSRLHSEVRLKEWLQARLAKETEQLILQTSDTGFRVAQGRAQVLREMLKLLDEAPKHA